MDSVTEPIWLTFSSRQLQAFLSTACWILFGLVTVKSSPTIWLEQKNQRVTIVTLYSRYWRFSLSSSRKNQLVYLRFHKANKRLGMPMIVAKRKKKKKEEIEWQWGCVTCLHACVHLTWMSTEEVNLAHCSQSSWSNGSSMDWTGERETLRRKFPQ